MQLRTVSRATRRRQGTSGGSNRAWTQRQCHEATQIYRSAFSNTNRATVSSTDSHLEVSVGLNVFAELSAQPACGSHAERLRPAHLFRGGAPARALARRDRPRSSCLMPAGGVGQDALRSCHPLRMRWTFERAASVFFFSCGLFFLSNCQIVKFRTAESRTFQNF